MTEKGIAFIGFLKSHNWYADVEDVNRQLEDGLTYTTNMMPDDFNAATNKSGVFRVRTESALPD